MYEYFSRTFVEEDLLYSDWWNTNDVLELILAISSLLVLEILHYKCESHMDKFSKFGLLIEVGTTPLVFNEIMPSYSSTDSGPLYLSWKQPWLI